MLEDFLNNFENNLKIQKFIDNNEKLINKKLKDFLINLNNENNNLSKDVIQQIKISIILIEFIEKEINILNKDIANEELTKKSILVFNKENTNNTMYVNLLIKTLNNLYYNNEKVKELINVLNELKSILDKYTNSNSINKLIK